MQIHSMRYVEGRGLKPSLVVTFAPPLEGDSNTEDELRGILREIEALIRKDWDFKSVPQVVTSRRYKRGW